MVRPVPAIVIQLPTLEEQKNIQVRTKHTDIQQPNPSYAHFLTLDLDASMEVDQGTVKSALSNRFLRISTKGPKN